MQRKESVISTRFPETQLHELSYQSVAVRVGLRYALSDDRGSPDSVAGVAADQNSIYLQASTNIFLTVIYCSIPNRCASLWRW